MMMGKLRSKVDNRHVPLRQMHISRDIQMGTAKMSEKPDKTHPNKQETTIVYTKDTYYTPGKQLQSVGDEHKTRVMMPDEAWKGCGWGGYDQ